mgnify:CR=1 FL=1
MSLNDIENHLLGKHTIGVYPLLEDNTSYFIPGFGYDIPYYDLENELTSRLCVYRKSKNHNKCHNNSYLDCMRSTYITENKLTKNNLNLHPNPTNNTISIQTDENRTINKINIFSINGKLIKSFQFKITEKPENLSVIKLPSGIYFVQVIGDDFVGSLKFVKE